MMGGDLPNLDAFRLSPFTDNEVLAVDQNSSGNRELFQCGSQVCWIANVPETKDKYGGLFNLGEEAAEITVSRKEASIFTAEPETVVRFRPNS